MMAKMPAETKIFAEKYADLIVLINQILKEKGYSQKNLAEKLEKRPSEINKWLNGEHNFTLRSIAKLEAELGESLVVIPVRKSVNIFHSNNLKRRFTVYTNLSDREEKVQVWENAKLMDTKYQNVG